MEPTLLTDDQTVNPSLPDTVDQPTPPAAPISPGGAQPSSAQPNALFVGGVWMLVLAVFLLLCGLCSGLLYLIVPFTIRNVESSTQTNIILGSLAGFTVIFGAVLVWQGIQTVRGRSSMSAARAFPPVPALALAFVGAILLGIGTLALPAFAVYVFPPWHLLAASLPPLALLAYAARRLGAASGLRALLVSFSWGAFAGTTVAFLLEIMIAVILVVFVSVVVASLPNSRALLDDLSRQLLQMQRSRDFSVMTRWLTQPAVLAGLLLYLAVIIPMIEEAIKALVVAFIDPRRTRPADAVLWGISAGAGFATIESILNGGALPSAWAPLILSRVGATIVHVANGALMGRGWYAARVERRWGQLLLSYAASVLFHAVWNGMAVLLSVQFPGFARSPAEPTGTLVGGALVLVMVILALVGLMWIVYAVRQQSRRQVVNPATQ